MQPLQSTNSGNSQEYRNFTCHTPVITLSICLASENLKLTEDFGGLLVNWLVVATLDDKKQSPL